jgi:hypothetical protein
VAEWNLFPLVLFYEFGLFQGEPQHARQSA